MPRWDRYWPFGMLGSLALLAASATLSVWYLASLFALPQRFGLPPLNSLGQAGGNIVLVGGFGGLWLLFMSRGARRRARLRRLALGGDPSEMPLATITPDPAHAPDAAHLPLVLPWRRTPRGREWGAPLFMTLLFSLAPAMMIVLVFVVPAVYGASGQDFIASQITGSIADLLDFIAVAALLALETGLAVAGLVAFIRALSSRLGPAYGVVADDEGISTLHLKGQGPRLRWADVRLVEVSLFASTVGEWIFTVYGPRASAYWQDLKQPRRKRLRLEISRADFEERQQALLALIAARTGLQPRTFATSLTRDDELAHRLVRSYRALAYGIVYGLAGMLVLLAVAALALPLTHNPLLDGYAALTCALAGIAVIVNNRQALKPARAALSPQGMGYMLPTAASLADEPVEVTYRRRFTGRLQDFAIGLVLVLDIVPAVVAEINASTFPLHGFAMRVVALLLFLVALSGLLALINAFTGRRAILTASASGLRKRAGRDTTQLAWDRIVSLSLELDKGGPDSFTALSRDGETITWPARGVIWRANRPGQPLVTAEEFGAIVARRSGVQITIKEA